MKTSQPLSSLSRFFHTVFQWNGKAPRPVSIALIAAAVLLVAGLVLTLFSFLIQWLWAWLVPDLFPAAVRDGSLAGSISLWTAFKILFALIVVGSLFRSNTSHHVQRKVTKQVLENVEAATLAKSLAEQEAAVTTGSARVFPSLVDPLTDRELEVLQLLGKGLTNQQIAVQVNLSESTVVYHIGHIFGKLRVNSRVEAAVWAKEHGII
jgi:DNA-binding CsgD family transcriptional regulator